MNNKEHKEFTPEELEEIRAYAEQEAAAPDEYRFSNPDPYAKPEPAPEGQPRRFWFDAEGHIRVQKPFRLLAAGAYLAAGDRRHRLLRHRQL